MAGRTVQVRWQNGYYEVFVNVTCVRFSGDLMYLEFQKSLPNQAKSLRNRHIPLRNVFWFSIYPRTEEIGEWEIKAPRPKSHIGVDQCEIVDDMTVAKPPYES